MGYIPMYAKGVGTEQASYLDDRLRPITEPTYGICIYQEQYMEIAKQLAGFSLAEADDLRKAIGKKIHSLMASLKDKFLEGCAGNGVTPAVANQLWKDMEGVGLLVQQVARRLLRADRLPDGLPAGTPPGRVHGGAHLLRHEHEGQGAVLRRGLRRDGGSRPSRRT